VRVIPDQWTAERRHRSALVQLIVDRHYDHFRYLEKNFPLDVMAKMLLPMLGPTGTSVEELLRVVIEQCLLNTCKGYPRNPDQLEAAEIHFRENGYTIAESLCKELDQAIKDYRDVNDWLEDYRSDENKGEIADDIFDQIDFLFAPNWAWNAGAQWLPQYRRYFDAIQNRIDRLDGSPITKDLDKLDTLAPYWNQWLDLKKHMPDDAQVEEIGWMLQEWRVSLFSPGSKVIVKVSEKRISKMLEALGC